MKLGLLILILVGLLATSCSGGRTLSRDFLSGPNMDEKESDEGGGKDDGDTPTPISGDTPPPVSTPVVELSKLTTGYTLSAKRLHLSAGESTTVTLDFASPTSQSAIIPFDVYGFQSSDFSQILNEPGGVIYVPEGAMSVSIDLTHPSTPSFATRTNLALALDRTNANDSRLVLSLHNSEVREMDQMSLASNHGCGIRGGKLYCWGADFYGIGYLGLGAMVTKAEQPTRVGDSETWTQISVAWSHSCGIDAGRLFCWGRDSSGQLGNGAGSVDQEVPTQLGADTGWTYVSTGPTNTCAINAGELWCWGADDKGLMGNDAGDNPAEAPEKIGLFTDWTRVSVGENHICGIESGRLYCWGLDDKEQLGNGAGVSPADAPLEIGNNSWSEVSVGSSHTCAIRVGELWCWGDDISGKVGNGAMQTADVATPQRIGMSTTWSEVNLGYGHSCGINGGRLFCWGSNRNGALGTGVLSSLSVYEPQQIGSLNNWIKVTTAYNSTCAVESDRMSCWGSNYSMQLGQGPGLKEHETRVTPLGKALEWTQLSSSDDFACGTLDGGLYCWGDDQFGRLGNGPTETDNILLPQRIGESSNWNAISTSEDFACGIESGRLYCWGRNSSGRLGNGQLAGDVEAPERIGTDSNWTHISTGRMHACGIESGNLYCWGADSGERLGNGAGTTNSAVPLQISISGGWTAVSVSDDHSCAINANRLFCWGQDNSGALGNGDGRTDAAQPEMVGASGTWYQVSTGLSHTCGIDGGRLYCWGRDISGQLGNGPGVTSANDPQQVGLDSTWTEVGAKNDHTCGIKAGELYCWGSNRYGQIATGIFYNTSTEDLPNRIGSHSDWQKLFMGDRTNYGIRADQTYMWGKSFIGDVFNEPSF